MSAPGGSGTQQTGRRLPMIVTFLEMTARPNMSAPPQPKGKLAILKAEKPTPHFYRYLYDTIGGEYFWVDRKKVGPDALAAIIQDPLNELYVLYTDGTPAGMAELDWRKPGRCNIAYFGLMPEAIGRGLGAFLLHHACLNAWSRDIQRLTINTCTLDHARALPLYQRMGFSVYAREERFVELP